MAEAQLHTLTRSSLPGEVPPIFGLEHADAESVGLDAIRIIDAEARERAREVAARDGELLSLIARHGPTLAKWEAADIASDQVRDAYCKAEGGRSEAERAALRESTGLNAANDLCETIATELNRIEDAIFDLTPCTFEGLQAKARWIASLPVAKDRAEHLLHDLCRMPPVGLASPSRALPRNEARAA